MKKALFLAVAAILALCLLTGCGGNAAQIRNIDGEANAFDIVDVRTGRTLEYSRLVILGKEVVDHEASGTSVIFAFEDGQIVRETVDEDGATVRRVTCSGGDAYTTAAKFEYTLADGVLTLTKLLK